MIAALDIRKGDTVIEIGPGKGALTEPLWNACREKNSFFIAIEKDGSLGDEIKSKFPGIDVRTGDALKILPDLPHVPSTKIIGNIPYYITGKLLRLLGDAPKKPRSVLMLQKEVALRLTAVPPRMNRLAAMVRGWADAEIIAEAPREWFAPPPEVDSAVVLLTPHGKVADLPRYFRTAALLFKQPRKTIMNNLRGHSSREKITALLAQMGIEPEDRPQDLDVEDINFLSQGL